MKILVIDNNIDKDCWGSLNLTQFGKLVPGATIHVRRGPQEDLPKNPELFDRVIVSGSKASINEEAPWIVKLMDFIKKWVETGKPLLGVCYGHQALARAFGGKKSVQVAPEPEFGWTEIRLTENSVLFEGLPREFYTFSSHFDEVAELPKSFKKIASSNHCTLQGIEYEGRPVFGIQFHPEKGLAEAEKILIERKNLGIPKILMNANEGKKLYDSSVGERIFANFFKL